MKKLTAERLREVLHYEPQTGVFIWIAPINNRIKVGNKAGSGSNGYINISIDGEIYGAHRLAWLYMTGGWPAHQIDHADGNRSNNAFSNLREATVSQNHQNIGITAANRTGLKGVSLHKKTGKWRARIAIEKKGKTIGYFDTKEEAHAAYCEAASRHYGKFANFGT